MKIKMVNMDKELKKLYKDAMYYHLLRDGCNERKAKLKVGQIFDK